MAERVLVLSVERSWASCARSIARAKPDWVVFAQPIGEPLPRFYAFRPEELPTEDADVTSITEHLDLRRDTASGVAYRTSIVDEPGLIGRRRVVVLLPTNEVIRVIVAEEVEAGIGIEGFDPSMGSGTRELRVRGIGKPTIDAIFSAGMPEEIESGLAFDVTYRIEAGVTAPDGLRFSAAVAPNVPINVSVTSDDAEMTYQGPREHSVMLNDTGDAITGVFTMQTSNYGLVRVAVNFRQSGLELGTVLLAAPTVPEMQAWNPVMRPARVAAPAPTEGLLTLVIDATVENETLAYRYELHSEEFGLQFVRKRSRPVGDRGQGPASTVQQYIEGIYEKVTVDLRHTNDAVALQRDAKALGVELSHELLDPEVIEVLWPLRHRVRCIQITSFEAYVPWELIRMQNTKTGEVDERYFAEYGLIRTLSGEMPPRRISLDRWAYLESSFPNESLVKLPADAPFFNTVLPERGITPVAIAPTEDAFFDAAASDTWDVLHLSCHAVSDTKAIDRASLVIGDRRDAAGAVRTIEISSSTIRSEARLRPRQPLVFLNACETGRVGVVLTSYGGWPEVFCRAGAGVFVGTSWAVRDEPAAAFAATFYRQLMGGVTLAKAATAAREAAKKLGDVSWLAYKVYGHPSATATAISWPMDEMAGVRE